MNKYDFYYSAKQADVLATIKGDNKYITTFKGQIFTHAIKTGNYPTGNFDDYVFLGTGVEADIKIRAR